MAPIFGVSAMAASVVVTPVVSAFTRQFSEEHNHKVFLNTEDPRQSEMKQAFNEA